MSACSSIRPTARPTALCYIVCEPRQPLPNLLGVILVCAEWFLLRYNFSDLLSVSRLSPFFSSSAVRRDQRTGRRSRVLFARGLAFGTPPEKLLSHNVPQSLQSVVRVVEPAVLRALSPGKLDCT